MKKQYFNRGDSIPKILIIYIILAAATVISVYPLLDVLKIALRPYSTLFTSDFSIIPANATLKNFYIVLFERDFLKWVRNSFIISASTSVIGVSLSITAAYAYSRYKFIGKNASMVSFLLTQIFPAPMLLLPTFILLRKFQLIGSFWGIIIPYVATVVPFSVWVLKGYFDTIPLSIEESARIDGANLFQTLFRIVLPLSLPAIGVTFLNSFMMAWNEYVIARIVLPDKAKHTLPVALNGMTGSFRTEWGIYSAASLLTAIPVMILFISMSKVMIHGLTLGGVKE